MACSRSEPMRGVRGWVRHESPRIRRGAFAVFFGCVVVFACALAFLMPLAAHADVDAMQQEPEPVSVVEVAASAFGMESRSSVVDGSAELEIARLCPMVLLASCDPASIEAGISCGMDWMCGLMPCLCGSADAWGGCSCNGLETVEPDVSFSSSDEGVVRVVQAAGSTWLVPVGEGSATITCTASLRYHEDTQASIEVTVGSPMLVDAVLGGLVVLAVCVVVGIVLGVRALVKRKKDGDVSR